MNPAIEGLFTIDAIRIMEKAARARLPACTLTQRAGKSAAEAAIGIVGPVTASSPGAPVPGNLILVAAGPGNNGADACECAALLAHQGYQVTLLLPETPCNPHIELTRALERARLAPITWVDLQALPALMRIQWALVIDGLFGIGLDRGLAGIWQTVVSSLNAMDAPILALDVPSGLNADTGTVMIDDKGNHNRPADRAYQPQAKICISASHTITFIADKPGLHTCDGHDHAGIVSVASLDIDLVQDQQPPACAFLTQSQMFSGHAPVRLQNSHKGRFGDVQVIGGAPGMVGAAVLAAHAALKSGAGRVLIGFPHAMQTLPLLGNLPELMCRNADDLDFSHGVLVVGSGLGSSEVARTLVARSCDADVHLVLDADGLNLVADAPELQAALADRATKPTKRATKPAAKDQASNGHDALVRNATLLTPHPLEAARLLGTTVAAVQSNRLAAAQMLAEKFSATVILKGSGTVIAHDGALWINSTGNPALASGGTGDVLAGMCGALLAQGWPVLYAALGAVWIHGAAADLLVARGTGPVGVTASEIIDAARTVINDVLRNVRAGS